MTDEHDWHFSRAYNLAAYLSPCDVLHMIPCQSPKLRMSVSSLAEQVRHQTVFFTSAAHSLPLLISRRVFFGVHAFDERISTETVAISNLAMRLDAHGIRERVVSVPHEMPEMTVTQVQEKLLLPYAALWNDKNASQYRVTPSLTISTIHRPHSLQHALPASIMHQTRVQAMGAVLHDVYDVPWLFVVRMNEQQLSELIQRVEQSDTKTLMIVHVAHGLGNRLRAFAAGKAFAEATGRSLMVVWERDAHCEASFAELFEEDGVIVLDGVDGEWPFSAEGFGDESWRKWKCYNYMMAEGGTKDEVLQNGKQHLYYRGAYVPRVEKGAYLKGMNKVLRELRAVEEIREEIEEMSERLKSSIGVHIRHGEPGDEITGSTAVSMYGSVESEVIRYWRSVCTAESFGKEVQQLWQRGESKAVEVFVATDCEECREKLAEIIGEAVWWMEGDMCSGGQRGVECVRRAVVELFGMGRCERVLGSMWSSFSEIAGRLKGGIRYAGAEFGRVGTEGWGEEVRGVAERVWKKRKERG